MLKATGFALRNSISKKTLRPWSWHGFVLVRSWNSARCQMVQKKQLVILYLFLLASRTKQIVHVYLDSVSLEFLFLPFCRRRRVFFLKKKKKRGRSKLLVRYADVRDVLLWIRLKVFFSVKTITGVASASNIKKHFNYKN